MDETVTSQCTLIRLMESEFDDDCLIKDDGRVAGSVYDRSLKTTHRLSRFVNASKRGDLEHYVQHRSDRPRVTRVHN